MSSTKLEVGQVRVNDNYALFMIIHVYLGISKVIWLNREFTPGYMINSVIERCPIEGNYMFYKDVLGMGEDK